MYTKQVTKRDSAGAMVRAGVLVLLASVATPALAENREPAADEPTSEKPGHDDTIGIVKVNPKG